MAAAGGEWIPNPHADPESLAAAVRAQGVRAIRAKGDLGWIRDLDQLEFVTAVDAPDVEPLASLPRLRFLSVLAWGGRLDGTAWPGLEWFGASEIPRGGGGLETVLAHPSLRVLDLDGYPELTLGSILSSRLEELSLGRSPKLTELVGAEAFAGSLRRLKVVGLSNLQSLEGIQAMAGLEVLHLGSLRHVTTIEVLAELPRLRYLDVIDLKNVETLAPLAGHPTLEYVAFGATADLDAAPLREIPHLKLISAQPPRSWRSRLDGLPQIGDLASDDPLVEEWWELCMR